MFYFIFEKQTTKVLTAGKKIHCPDIFFFFKFLFLQFKLTGMFSVVFGTQSGETPLLFWDEYYIKTRRKKYTDETKWKQTPELLPVSSWFVFHLPKIVFPSPPASEMEKQMRNLDYNI